MIKPYNVMCVQSMIRKVKSKASKDGTIRENIYRNLSLVEAQSRHMGTSPKIVVFPEFFLQGYPLGESLEEWAAIAIRVPGEETAILSSAAKEGGVYLAAHAYEVDDDWPGRIFNTAFIIDPQGEVILRYRKINSPITTTPGDVFTEYVERYGIEGVFPVVDTPYGKLACMICYDVNFPEVARCLAMRGAEVILHLTGEPHASHRESWECAKRARAYENLVYLVSSNHGMYISPLDDSRFADASGPLFEDRQATMLSPMFRSYGRSMIIGYDGKIMAVIDGVGEATISARLEIESLRYARQQPAMNFLSQLRTGLFAPMYSQTELFPLDSFAKNPMANLWEDTRDINKQTIERLTAKGIYTPPSG